LDIHLSLREHTEKGMQFVPVVVHREFYTGIVNELQIPQEKQKNIKHARDSLKSGKTS